MNDENTWRTHRNQIGLENAAAQHGQCQNAWNAKQGDGLAAWSTYGRFLAVAHDTTPFVVIYHWGNGVPVKASPVNVVNRAPPTQEEVDLFAATQEVDAICQGVIDTYRLEMNEATVKCDQIAPGIQ